MNEIAVSERQLPDNLEDLAKFVLVGREKLNAVRAEIRAIKAVNLAVEVHEQKLSEAQDIAEAVLDAEAKIGELTRQMEKAQGFASIRPTVGENVKTKTEQLADLGIKHPERFENLSKHPEAVHKAKEEARDEGRIVTRKDVEKQIMFENAMNTPPIESRAQREARELREAKKRHEEFEQAKAEKVVSLADAVQDKEDMAEIADDFYEDFIKIGSKMLLVNNMIRDGSLKDILKAMDRRELSDLLNRARDYMGIMVRLQRTISEVDNEK